MNPSTVEHGSRLHLADHFCYAIQVMGIHAAAQVRPGKPDKGGMRNNKSGWLRKVAKISMGSRNS
jgi:hypothetical protein